jgi:hypothetical protein
MRPKLRIEQADIQESRNCFIYVRNAGKRTASNVRIKFFVIESKRKSKADKNRIFRTLNPNSPKELQTFDLDPDETRRIRVCEVTEEDRRAIFAQDDRDFKMPSFSLERGYKYELLIRFVGKNFSDRKVWHLSLDLSHDQPKFNLVFGDMLS